MAFSLPQRRRLRFVLTAYLGIVTLGFSLYMDAVHQASAAAAGGKRIAGGAFLPEDYADDFQAGNAVLVSGASGHSFSPAHKPLSRIMTPGLGHPGGTVFAPPSFKAVTGVKHSNPKSAILLKLRI